MSLVSKAFSDIVTFSRSSNATRIGPTGRVEYAPHNTLPYSEQFDNAAWTKYYFTVTANSIAAPNGTITADKAVPSTDNNLHHLYSSATVSTGVKYTLSVYAKSSGYNYLDLGLIYNSTFYTGAQFNLNTGVIVRSGAGLDSTIENVTITSVGNGWYRCSATVTAGIAGMVFNASASNVEWISGAFHDASFSGDGASGIYLWGAQLSVGPYPLDYTPTTSAAVYGPRFDYDPVTLAARGLLIEEQRTNLAPYSEQIDLWDRVSATTAANTATAPDGQNTAETILFSGTTATWDIVYRGTFGVGTYTFSIWLKTADNSTKTVYVSWGIPDLSRSSALTVTGTWQRFSVTFTVPSGETFNVHLGNVNTLTPAGWSAFNIYAWGGQVEAGSFATSYLPTLASSVTRSADVASVNTLSPWYSSTEGTLFAEAANIAASTTASAASLNNGTADNSLWIGVVGGTTTGRAQGLVSGSAVATLDSAGVYSSGSTARGAFAFKQNDFALCFNGGTVQTDTSGNLPTVTTLSLGALPNGERFFNGHLRRIAVYPRRLTNAELQSLTA